MMKTTGVGAEDDTALVLDGHDGIAHLFFGVEEVLGLLFLCGETNNTAQPTRPKSRPRES